ncbi:MAG: cbb3-type cytochrome oxidase assembly protein CcoS [Verrucomicrobia bacterium]|nr:cbb3-type cytochrome oxidase assembly protein CcoS [Verrucomicrobiota bacterium]
MSVILICILASLGVAVAFLAGFIWAVKSGQYEDTCTPALRVVMDEDAHRENSSTPVNVRSSLSVAHGGTANHQPPTTNHQPVTAHA